MKEDAGIMGQVDLIILLLAGISDSIEKYETARRKQNRKHPFCGYGDLEIGDSKESIQRRITVLREELLKLSKSL